MPKQVTMPETVDDAVDRLDELNRLMTATGWELAAILATFVKPDQGTGQSKQVGRTAHLLSARDFAAKGVRGLRSHHTVLRYVNMWNEQVGTRPRPGRTVTLPTRPWPPEAANIGSRATVTGVVRKMNDDHGFACEVAEQLDRRTRLVVESKLAGLRPRSPLQPAGTARSIDDRWASWIGDLSRVMTDGAGLAEETERTRGLVLGAHAAIALATYQRLVERHIDAELRQLLESEAR